MYNFNFLNFLLPLIYDMTQNEILNNYSTTNECNESRRRIPERNMMFWEKDFFK